MLVLARHQLLELAADRRTYLVRMLAVLVVALFFLLAGSEALAVGDARRSLGTGRPLFAQLVALLFVCIYLGTPALVAPAIAREAGRGRLDLLQLAGLGAADLALAPLAALLVHAGSLLLVALPVGALAMALGGVGGHEVAIAAFCLAAALLQAASVSLWLGAEAARPEQAAGRAYLRLPLHLLLIVPLCSLPLMIPLWAIGADYASIQPAFLFVQCWGQRTADPLLAMAGGLPALAVPPVYAWLTVRAMRARLERPRPAPPTLLRPRFAAPREKAGWLARWLVAEPLPGDDPLGWRERWRTPGLRRQDIGAWGGAALLAAWVIVGTSLAETRGSGGPRYLALAVTAAGQALLAALAAGIAPSLRAAGHEALLATPLSGRALLLGGMAGTRRLAALLTAAALAATAIDWMRCTAFQLPQAPPAAIWPALAAALALLPWQARWLGLLAGARAPQRGLAALAGVVAVLALNILPPLAAQPLAAWCGWSRAAEVVALASPTALLLQLCGRPETILPLVALAGHAAATLALRRLLLGAADRLVGRGRR